MDACIAPATDKLVVDVAFPFTLSTPKYGPSRPFTGNHAAKAAYVDALEAELASLDDEVRARPASAVRLSGGASIMSADKVCHLVRRIKKTLTLAPGAEISIDVEPLTVCTPSLTDWTSCGITRVNLAALSCNDSELAALGAHHSREQFQNALLFLEKFHMANVNFEVLYGVPGQTEASWKRTLLTLAGIDAPHISIRPLVDAASDKAWAAPASEANMKRDASNKESAHVLDTPADEMAAAQDRSESEGAHGLTSETDATQKDTPAPIAPLPSPDTRRDLYEQAQLILSERGYVEVAPGDFVKPSLASSASAFGQLVRAGADVLGLGAGARSRLDGFLYENACDYDLYVAKSADFEAIARSPLREDERSLRARICPPIENLTASQRFELLETIGASLAR